jgi:hypothetical protein
MTDVAVPPSGATGWPTIDDLATFTGQPATDPDLVFALDAAISYGELTLGDRYLGPVSSSIHRAAMDYAGSIYTERIGQADVTIESFYGSTPLSRYRRILMTNRFTALA